MSLTLLAYQDTADVPYSVDALAEALDHEDGLSWGAQEGDYRPFSWQEPATGAQCQGDIGHLSMEAVEPGKHDEEKNYSGFQHVPLSVHIPLPVPHWFVIETANLLDRLSSRLPGLLWLNTEYTGVTNQGEAGMEEEVGPGPLDRPTLLSSWEELSYAQRAASSQQRQLDRHSSLALWRYRREQGATTHETAKETAVWPSINVLQGPEHAVSVCPWPADQSATDIILPPADLILVTQPESRLVSYQQAADALSAVGIADHIGRLCPAQERAGDWWQQCDAIDLGNIQAALGDDWLD